MKTKHKLEAQRILRAVGECWHVDPFLLRCKTRRNDVVEARDAAIYLIKCRVGVINEEIGTFLGGRIASTVSHSMARTDDRLASDCYTSGTWRRRLRKARAILNREAVK